MAPQESKCNSYSLVYVIVKQFFRTSRSICVGKRRWRNITHVCKYGRQNRLTGSGAIAKSISSQFVTLRDIFQNFAPSSKRNDQSYITSRGHIIYLVSGNSFHVARISDFPLYSEFLDYQKC